VHINNLKWLGSPKTTNANCKFNVLLIGADMKEKSFLSALLIVLMVSGLAFECNMHFGNAQSGTNESGIIGSDTTWTKANSPYTLTGPVGIANGVTLTIESGVTVNLGSFYLEVNGTLNAQGTSADKIVFNSNNQITGPPLNWNTYFPGSNARQNIFLAYDNPTCRIENAILSQTSIDGESSISTATVTINGCSLEGNSAINVWGSTTISNSYITGAVLLRGASVVSDSTFLNGIDIAGGSSGTSFVGTYAVSGNNITNQQGMYVMNVGDAGTITDNIIWGGSVAGICQADGFPTMSATIERNLIINNQIGILMRKDDDSTIQYNTITNNKVGISNPAPLQTITGNNIQGNSQYNMQAGQTMATAKNNWWGTTDTAVIDQKIYDFNDDFNLGKINYTPILTVANPEAMPDPNASIPTPATSPSPTASPTPTPTPNASASPSQNPTATPDQSGSQNTLGLDWAEIVIIALLSVIAVLLVFVIVFLRKRTVK
jgi:parallel beta-helix repeat protein